jgi:predicted protein tyrosine phosphatase
MNIYKLLAGIPDEYEFMEPGLVRLLEAKVSPYLKTGTVGLRANA